MHRVHAEHPLGIGTTAHLPHGQTEHIKWNHDPHIRTTQKTHSAFDHELVELDLTRESLIGLKAHLERYGLAEVPGIVSEDATTALRSVCVCTSLARIEQSSVSPRPGFEPGDPQHEAEGWTQCPRGRESKQAADSGSSVPPARLESTGRAPNSP